MPWCTTCDRFYNPNTLDAEGACPSGHQVADVPDPEAAPEKLRKFSDEPAPWHFKVLLGVTGVYLGFRLLQMAWWGAEWVLQH